MAPKTEPWGTPRDMRWAAYLRNSFYLKGLASNQSGMKATSVVLCQMSNENVVVNGVGSSG